MLDGLFIVSLIGTCVQAFKEAFEPAVPIEKNPYPEPHKNPVTGKIIVENSKLYHEDVDKYGAVQAEKWVKQGRYNLSEEDFEKEKERIRAEYKRLHNN